MDDDRYATQRGRYISRATELREPEAKAVAYSERGYSRHGIAKSIDRNENTVQDYLERAQARYGLNSILTLFPNQFDDPPELEPAEPGYHRNLSPKEEKIKWLKLVDKHSDKLPQEWVLAVFDAAEQDGLARSKLR